MSELSSLDRVNLTVPKLFLTKLLPSDIDLFNFNLFLEWFKIAFDKVRLFKIKFKMN